jgi:hypothetical protein
MLRLLLQRGRPGPAKVRLDDEQHKRWPSPGQPRAGDRRHRNRLAQRRRRLDAGTVRWWATNQRRALLAERTYAITLLAGPKNAISAAVPIARGATTWQLLAFSVLLISLILLPCHESMTSRRAGRVTHAGGRGTPAPLSVQPSGGNRGTGAK